MRVNDTKGSRNKFPDTPTIEELIGVTNEDMETAFGVKWRSSLHKLVVYMKSQEKRSLEDCLPILDDFICAWEDAGIRYENKSVTNQ